MSALLWLSIPLVALLLATLWVAWTSRPRPRADTHETVAEHRRFVEALQARTAAAAASRPYADVHRDSA